MSKSPRNSSSTSQNPRTRIRNPAAPPPRPWGVINGSDYGFAIASAHELADWFFDLAARDVTHSPESLRCVRSARSYVHDQLRGKRSRDVPIADVVFCAGLIARAFETDLKLGAPETIALFDYLYQTVLSPDEVSIATLQHVLRAAAGSWAPAPAECRHRSSRFRDAA